MWPTGARKVGVLIGLLTCPACRRPLAGTAEATVDALWRVRCEMLWAQQKGGLNHRPPIHHRFRWFSSVQD